MLCEVAERAEHPEKGSDVQFVWGSFFRASVIFMYEKSFRTQKNSNKENGLHGIMNEAVIKTNMSNFLLLPEVIYTDKQAMRLSSTLTKRDTICV